MQTEERPNDLPFWKRRCVLWGRIVTVVALSEEMMEVVLI
jgi:hypothetical protein